MKKFDWLLIVLVFGLIGIGLLSLYSTTHNWENELWKKQLLWVGISTIGLFGASFIDYSILKKYSFFIYIFTIFLLFVVLFMPPIRSASSWFRFFGISIQPSEFAKIGLIIFLSEYLKDKTKRLTNFSQFIPSIIITAIPVFLILLQPDIGSSIVFFPILFVLLYLCEPNRFIFRLLITFFLVFAIGGIFFSFLAFKGISLKSIFTGCIVGYLCLFFIGGVLSQIKKTKKPLIVIFTLVLSIFLSAIFVHTLKKYQRMRLVVFLNPSIDPFSSGYNILQSKIAIGSGGIFGKGFLGGTQSHLGFLPERATDFIFSVWAEEFGFLGVIILDFLALVLVLRGISIAQSTQDPFAKLLACGISTMIGVSFFVNMGICIGILPATGIPLPFISYGGSSLLVNMTSIGILISIKKTSSYG